MMVRRMCDWFLTPATKAYLIYVTFLLLQEWNKKIAKKRIIGEKRHVFDDGILEMNYSRIGWWNKRVCYLLLDFSSKPKLGSFKRFIKGIKSYKIVVIMFFKFIKTSVVVVKKAQSIQYEQRVYTDTMSLHM